MRLSRTLVCAVLIACCSPLTLAAAPGSFCAAALQPGGAPAFDPSQLGSPEEPIYLTGPCTVSRDCNHPPPYSISCSGSYSTSTCSSGPDGYGWVMCDGNYIECPPPPPTCTGSCFSTVQCWNICTLAGGEPDSYLCDISQHCCLCYYYD